MDKWDKLRSIARRAVDHGCEACGFEPVLDQCGACPSWVLREELDRLDREEPTTPTPSREACELSAQTLSNRAAHLRDVGEGSLATEEEQVADYLRSLHAKDDATPCHRCVHWRDARCHIIEDDPEKPSCFDGSRWRCFSDSVLTLPTKDDPHG